MNKAIVTFADGEKYKAVFDETRPLLQDYADRIGAELVVYETEKKYAVPHYKKLDAITDTLKKFDRVAWVDSDILVSKKAPSIFDEVPVGNLGIFNEAKWIDRAPAIEEWRKLTGHTLPAGIYFNTGVMVLEKEHSKIFEQPSIPIYHFGEQTYLNQQIHSSGVRIISLSHHWNRMGCTYYQLGEEPYLSFFLHFAGLFQDPSAPEPANVVRETREKWEKADWLGTKIIVVHCQNGMGNQVATVPAIEFMLKRYQDYAFIIHTAFPEVFEHLKSSRVGVVPQGENKFPPFAKQISTASAVGIQDTLCHPTDYHSISLFGRQLPHNERRITVPVKPCGVELDKWTIAVHAGKSGWLSKEMPQSLWQKIVNDLKGHGFKIVTIGVESMALKPTWGSFHLDNVDADFIGMEYSKTNDVIRQAWMTLTNDSMPVFPAGAYNNWIGLITIAKRPEHILPYRDESNLHRTLFWTGKPYWEVVPEPCLADPNKEYNITALYPGQTWPNPDQVVADILAAAKNDGYKEAVHRDTRAPEATL